MKTYKVEFFRYIGSTCETVKESFKVENLSKESLYKLPYQSNRELTKAEQKFEINKGLKSESKTFEVWANGCKAIITT